MLPILVAKRTKIFSQNLLFWGFFEAFLTFDLDFVFVSSIIHRREEYRNGRAMGTNRYVAHLDPFGKVSVHFCHLVTVHSRTLFKSVRNRLTRWRPYGKGVRLSQSRMVSKVREMDTKGVASPEISKVVHFLTPKESQVRKSQKSFISGVLLPFTAVHFPKVLEIDKHDEDH